MCAQTVIETEKTSIGFTQIEQWLEAMPVGIIMIDTKGSITHANQLALDVFSFNPSKDKWDEVLSNNVKGTSDNGHYIFTFTNKYILLKTQALPYKQGQIVLLIDVSDIKENNESTIKIEKISSLAKLSATLAHQLRTPLSTAYLYASNLSHETVSKDELKNYQNKIVEQLNNIKQEIDNVLLVHKGFEAVCEKINIVSEVHLLEQTFKALHAQMLIRVNTTCDNNILIAANRVALRGALNNLVENAIQASTLSNHMDINVHSTVSEVMIEIVDYGDGISQENLNKVATGIFTTKKDGNGLGLAISKKIIEAHGGALNIDSILGKYTKVSIMLPLLKEKA